MNVKMSTQERIFQAILFEVLAVTLSIIGLIIFTEHPVSELSGTMITVATIAMGWNFIFNWYFDRFATGAKEQRSFVLRLFHVILFQGGLLIFTIPVIAYILNIGLWQALLMDIGVTLFITFYAFMFNLIYDHTRACLIRSKQVRSKQTREVAL